MNEEFNRQSKVTTAIKKTANILREIITIIMAIAFTTAIVMFMTNGTNIPKEFSKFELTSIFAFVCLITAIIRFFHGNVSYISRTYDLPDYEAVARKYFLGKKIIILIPDNFDMRKVPMIEGLAAITYCGIIGFNDVNTL
ncbi:hypothetical protein ACFLXT_04650 [Chloroflexota bacterium]